jgi:DNA-directed RNA polymerase specialized sigma24 family protein
VTDAEFQAAFDQHKNAVYRFAWRMSGSATLDA